MSVTRTFTTFSIRWDRGSTWSSYDTADEAQAIIDNAARRGEVGHIESKTFTVEVPVG